MSARLRGASLASTERACRASFWAGISTAALPCTDIARCEAPLFKALCSHCHCQVSVSGPCNPLTKQNFVAAGSELVPERVRTFSALRRLLQLHTAMATPLLERDLNTFENKSLHVAQRLTKELLQVCSHLSIFSNCRLQQPANGSCVGQYLHLTAEKPICVHSNIMHPHHAAALQSSFMSAFHTHTDARTQSIMSSTVQLGNSAASALCCCCRLLLLVIRTIRACTNCMGGAALMTFTLP